MDNGDSIPSNRSATQGTLILPFINDTNKYYLIYLNNYTTNNFTAGLYYAVIDMTMNAGAGKVISKNSLLINDTLTEKLTAIRHGNGQDWWILTHDVNNNKFYKILLTQSGFSNDTAQFIGSNSSLSNNIGYMGQLIFSPNGSYLCNASMGQTGILDIFDFDRCSGNLSNWQNINPTGESYYGCSFSPSEKKLYASTYPLALPSKLFQFNLDSVNIINTKTLLHIMVSNYLFGGHLLAPNGKIYVTNSYWSIPNTIYSIYNMNLTVINDPDSVGLNCNVLPYSFSLGGRRCFFGLPNMINYRLGAVIDSCNTTSINSIFNNPHNIAVHPNPFTTEISITTQQQDINKALLIIKNILGQTIFNEQQNNLRNTYTKTIDLSFLPEGIYFLDINIDGERTVKKIVKE